MLTDYKSLYSTLPDYKSGRTREHTDTNVTNCKCWRIINPHTQHCRIANPAEHKGEPAERKGSLTEHKRGVRQNTKGAQQNTRASSGGLRGSCWGDWERIARRGSLRKGHPNKRFSLIIQPLYAYTWHSGSFREYHFHPTKRCRLRDSGISNTWYKFSERVLF